MKFFTPAWASGDLDAAETDNVVQRYNDLLATFDRDGQIYRFATTVSLNDAYLDRVIVDQATDRVELLLLTGDLQIGYWRTSLLYGSARVAAGKSVLLRGLSSRPTEIWYDEFASSLDGSSHTFLLAPLTKAPRTAGEFRIDFQDFSFNQVRANGRELATSENQSVWG